MFHDMDISQPFNASTLSFRTARNILRGAYGWLREQPRAFHSFIKVALVMDLGKHTDAREVRAMQMAELQRLTPWMMIANICNAVIAGANLGHPPMAWVVDAWCVVVCLLAARTLYIWKQIRDRPARKHASVRSIVRATRHATILGALWGILPLIVLPNGTVEDQVLVTNIVAGMSAGGAFALAPVPTAAIAYLGMLLIPALGAIAVGYIPASLQLFLFGVIYFITLWVTVIYRFREFCDRARDRSAIEHQSETIGLLLKEFETSASDWLWEADRNWRLTYASQRLSDLTGIGARQLIGLPLTEIAKIDESSEEWGHIVTQLHAGRTAREVVVEANFKNDTQWLSITARPIVDKDGVVVGYRGVTTDISERILARQALERHNEILADFNMRLEEEVAARTQQAAKATQAAEKANEAKSIFLAKMSHEIRSPMNGIFGMTDVLARTELTDQQARFVSTISSSAKSLLTVVNDILDLSRAETGHLELERREFDLRQSVEGAVQLFEESANGKGINLSLYVAQDVPSIVWGDKDRLRQICINLIGNSVKFTDTGDVAVRVDVVSEQMDTAKLRFSVHDTGIGIAPDTVGTLCTPFVQADSSISRKFGGTGLGLSISRHLIELMGGHLDISSELGEGTVISFDVPFRKGNEAKADSERQLTLPNDTRVLVVDDQKTTREIITKYLSTTGANIVSVDNATQALKEAKSAVAAGDPFSAAVLDMAMQKNDGLELLKTIKSDPALSDLRTLVVTPINGQDELETNQQLGFDASLTKPIRQTELISKLVATLGTTVPSGNIVREHEIEDPAFNARVLVADDNPVNVEVAYELLSGFGCTVETANTGIEAVEKFTSSKFDLVLMDCQMPEIDGLTATIKIREAEAAAKQQRTPIVAVTAHAYAEDKVRCLASGMDDYLSKPYTAKQLAQVVSRWLERDKHQPRGRVPAFSHQKGEKIRAKPSTCAGLKPAPAPHGTTTWMERNELLQLVDEFGAPTACKLLDTLHATIDDFLGELDAIEQKSDVEALRRLTHKISGSAATLHAGRLAALSREVNARAHKSRDYVKTDVGRMRRALVATKDRIGNLRKFELHEANPHASRKQA